MIDHKLDSYSEKIQNLAKREEIKERHLEY